MHGQLCIAIAILMKFNNCSHFMLSVMFQGLTQHWKGELKWKLSINMHFRSCVYDSTSVGCNICMGNVGLILELCQLITQLHLMTTQQIFGCNDLWGMCQSGRKLSPVGFLVWPQIEFFKNFGQKRAKQFRPAFVLSLFCEAGWCYIKFECMIQCSFWWPKKSRRYIFS